jgi:hypothetical protein
MALWTTILPAEKTGANVASGAIISRVKVRAFGEAVGALSRRSPTASPHFRFFAERPDHAAFRRNRLADNGIDSKDWSALHAKNRFSLFRGAL